jgi:hypothetical protein
MPARPCFFLTRLPKFIKNFFDELRIIVNSGMMKLPAVLKGIKNACCKRKNDKTYL